MAFGAGYRPVEGFNKLEAGIYEARIVEAKGIDNNGKKHIEVALVYNNQPLNSIPNKANVWDCPTQPLGKMDMEKTTDMWCQQMTQFFDSFGITRGDFHFAGWVGKVGKVTVRPQHNKPQYKEVVLYETSYETKKTDKKPDQVSALETAFDGMGFAVAPENEIPSNF